MIAKKVLWSWKKLCQSTLYFFFEVVTLNKSPKIFLGICQIFKLNIILYIPTPHNLFITLGTDLMCVFLCLPISNSLHNTMYIILIFDVENNIFWLYSHFPISRYLHLYIVWFYLVLKIIFNTLWLQHWIYRTPT